MTKRACVLSGDGAKGVWQAAVLCDEKKTYDKMFGVSSGSLNATGWSILGPGLKDLAGDIKGLSSLFGFNYRFLWDSGVLTAKPLIADLTKRFLGMPFEIDTEFPNILCPSGTLQYHTYPQGWICNSDDIETIASSAAMAGVVAAVRGCVDGGFRTLAPISRAIDQGFDEIDVIMGQNPFTAPAWPDPAKPGPFGFANFGLSIVWTTLWQIMHDDIAFASQTNNGRAEIRLVYPSVDLGSTLSFKDCAKISDLKTYTPVFYHLSPMGMVEEIKSKKY